MFLERSLVERTKAQYRFVGRVLTSIKVSSRFLRITVIYSQLRFPAFVEDGAGRALDS
jgi:hypothetical protein